MIYAASALLDMERIVEHVANEAPELRGIVVRRVSEAVSLLGDHPLMGRSVEHGLRQLVISRGRTGFVALYRFLEQDDVVLILALRHQREAGVQRF